MKIILRMRIISSKYKKNKLNLFLNPWKRSSIKSYLKWDCIFITISLKLKIYNPNYRNKNIIM